MNTAVTTSVEARIRQPRGVTRIAMLWVTMIACWGCIEIEGGAAEVAWSLRSFEGVAVEACADARIGDVRLCWEPAGDGSVSAGGGACRAGDQRRFPCEESSGVTGFQLDPGSTAFWIEPICIDEEPAAEGTYQVPPPIVRTVERGEIVSLNSLLLVVSPPGDDCPAGVCTCVRP
jgi:hypothetical protein